MLKRLLSSAVAAAALLCATSVAAPAAAAPTPPTADSFSRLPAIDQVQISPDGKHIVALTSPDGKTALVTIWSTDALDKPPAVIPPGQGQRLMNVEFLKNDRLAITFRQLLDIGNYQGHLFRTVITGIDVKAAYLPLLKDDVRASDDVKFANAVSQPTIIDTLERDPRHILVEDTRATGNDDIYKVDVYTGVAEKVLHGSDRFSGYATDLKGEIRARQELGFDNGKVYIAQWIKHPDTGAWEEHFRWYAKEREPMDIIGFTDDPNIVLLATNKGRDKTAIYEYDIRNKKLLNPAFEHTLFNATGVMRSHAPADYGRILGFSYGAERTRHYWTDEKQAATEDGLRKALGAGSDTLDWTDASTGSKSRLTTSAGFDVSVTGYSDDQKYMIVEKSGPKQPPEYYLLIDGKQLKLLGRSRPQIDAAALGDTRLVEYAARDGLMIPAFLTTPPKSVFGAGPYPSIVLPHGGPWARDEMDWDFSGWTQYFAARGYAVIQPQFRGSRGWGQKIWRAGDAEWGQKMQDDDEDAARWLVGQGLAQPDRIALHGYSYGGYAAFAGAVRANGVWQCTIAGAGVAELKSFRGEIDQSRFGREFQKPTVDGLDPLSQAAKVSVPMLIYHGARDHTVPVRESRQFVEKLKAMNRPYKYVELKDMGHQYVLWSPDDQKTVLETIETYLKNDCGPGGL